MLRGINGFPKSNGEEENRTNYREHIEADSYEAESRHGVSKGSKKLPS